MKEFSQITIDKEKQTIKSEIKRTEERLSKLYVTTKRAIENDDMTTIRSVAKVRNALLEHSEALRIKIKKMELY